jgi:hypothetical protein
MRIQKETDTTGKTETPFFVIESEERTSRYFYVPEEGERQEITDEVKAERESVADVVGKAIAKLIEPDIVIDNREVFYLHRQKDDQDIYFIINPTYSVQNAEVRLPGNVQPIQWDPSTGVERLVSPSQVQANRTVFNLELPPVGSAFILVRPHSGRRVIETNFRIESVDGQIRGYGRDTQAFAVVESDGEQKRLTLESQEPTDALTLDGDWEFQLETENALVLGKWHATQETTGTEFADYFRNDADTKNWLLMVPGAWSYQLPAEPESDYPIPVWYRIAFQADYLPPKLNMIVDGFAGSDWTLYVNGERATDEPVRSNIDGQMKAVDITSYLKRGLS